MIELIAKIKNDIIQAVESDQIVLPTLPEVALQVRTAAADDNVDVSSLVSVISNDPALAARFIRIANSPLMRPLNAIEDLYTAISRLGINYTANFATGLAMRQMFVSTSKNIELRMHDVWVKSTEIAGICHVLAAQYTRLKPDQASLAGLVHKIGVLPILTFAEDHHELLDNTKALDLLIEQTHPEIGRKILETWEFPTELQVVPEEHLHYQREAEAAELADVVLVATLQSAIGDTQPLPEIDFSSISAFSRLGLDCEIDSIEAQDLAEEVESAVALFQ